MLFHCGLALHPHSDTGWFVGFCLTRHVFYGLGKGVRPYTLEVLWGVLLSTVYRVRFYRPLSPCITRARVWSVSPAKSQGCSQWVLDSTWATLSPVLFRTSSDLRSLLFANDDILLASLSCDLKHSQRRFAITPVNLKIKTC